ncbi:hypothetical protein [Hoeflea sp. 108]|uniref:hypothetical protein n=1 Tax=Hoeflea sp. 108 TaxID=1116369 RepID=UPI0009DAF89B
MIRAVLLDLSGVVYDGDRPIPGAVAAIGRLRAEGLPIRFVSNTTRSPHRAIVAHSRALVLQSTATSCSPRRVPRSIGSHAKAARRISWCIPISCPNSPATSLVTGGRWWSAMLPRPSPMRR